MFLLLKTLFSRRLLLTTLVVLLGMAFLARLGIWQLDRLEQRRQQNDELRLALEAPPLQLNQETLSASQGFLKDRNVTVTGEYDFDSSMVLLLQNWSGQTGVHLVTPLLVEGQDIAILVDRGWIPESERMADEQSRFDLPGLVTVDGYIANTQTSSRAVDSEAAGSEGVAFKREWYRIDIEAIQGQMPYDLLPVYMIQSPAPGGDDDFPFHHEREIDLSDGPHLGYAVQWFIFSSLLGLIYAISVNRSLAGSENEE